jgi:hypothetical protein
MKNQFATYLIAAGALFSGAGVPINAQEQSEVAALSAVSALPLAFVTNDKRFSDRIVTVTVDPVSSWLQRAQMTPTGKTPMVIKL